MKDYAYTTLKDETINNAIYANRDFYGSYFKNVTFSGCAFITCDFEACVFSECVFDKCYFDNDTKEQLEDSFGDVVIM